jgi:Na+-driven multidrug efflux pump
METIYPPAPSCLPQIYPEPGINIAVSSLVGQQLGSGRTDDARRIVSHGLILTTVIGIFFCIVYYSFARPIILAFDHDPAVLAAAEPFIKLMALAFLFSGPMFPLVSAMNGAGDTKPPMIVALLANWALKLPLAYALAFPFGLGVNGVWLGIFVSVIFETLFISWWYRRGTWLTKRI